MTCNEAILAFMARISLDSLESATSSLLLVRAELWHYALQKVRLRGFDVTSAVMFVCSCMILESSVASCRLQTNSTMIRC